MIGFLERVGFVDGFKYFARSHQHVEQSHEVFDESSRSKLESIVVPGEFVAEAWEAIDRTFAGMTRINDDLYALLGAPAESLVVPRARTHDVTADPLAGVGHG
jgi:hypothetical protein